MWLSKFWHVFRLSWQGHFQMSRMSFFVPTPRILQKCQLPSSPVNQGVRDGGLKCSGHTSFPESFSSCATPPNDKEWLPLQWIRAGCCFGSSVCALCRSALAHVGFPSSCSLVPYPFPYFWVVSLPWLCCAPLLCGCLCPLQHCLIGDDFLHTEHLGTVGFCSVLLTLWHHLPSKVVLMGFHWARLYYSPGSMLGVFKNKQNLFRQATHEHWHLQQNWGFHTVWYFVEQKYLCLIGSKVGKWPIAWSGLLIVLVYYCKRPHKALFPIPFF